MRRDRTGGLIVVTPSLAVESHGDLGVERGPICRTHNFPGGVQAGASPGGHTEDTTGCRRSLTGSRMRKADRALPRCRSPGELAAWGHERVVP